MEIQINLPSTILKVYISRKYLFYKYRNLPQGALKDVNLLNILKLDLSYWVVVAWEKKLLLFRRKKELFTRTRALKNSELKESLKKTLNLLKDCSGQIVKLWKIKVVKNPIRNIWNMVESDRNLVGKVSGNIP